MTEYSVVFDREDSPVIKHSESAALRTARILSRTGIDVKVYKHTIGEGVFQIMLDKSKAERKAKRRGK